MATLGRALQLFGLILLPAALIYGTTSEDPRRTGIEIGAIALGGLAFVVGTAMQRRRG